MFLDDLALTVNHSRAVDIPDPRSTGLTRCTRRQQSNTMATVLNNLHVAHADADNLSVFVAV